MTPTFDISRVRYQSAVSIDGFITPEDGSLDWLEPYNADGADEMRAFIKEIGGAIVGRTTFDQGVAMGGVAIFGKTPTLIMTSRPIEVELPETMIVASGDPAAALARLTDMMKSGDVWLMAVAPPPQDFLDFIAAVERITIRLRNAGVTLATGTDTASTGAFDMAPGASLIDELELLQESGVAPIDIIRAATSIPAHTLEVDNRTGSIAAGKDADFLLLSADPGENVGDFRSLRAVYKNGAAQPQNPAPASATEGWIGTVLSD